MSVAAEDNGSFQVENQDSTLQNIRVLISTGSICDCHTIAKSSWSSVSQCWGHALGWQGYKSDGVHRGAEILGLFAIAAPSAS